MSAPHPTEGRFVRGARVVRAWTRLYTRGLPPDVRDARRAELDADIWEQQRHARLRGDSEAITSQAIFLRALRGVPDDLGWRREASAADHTSLTRIPAMALSYRTTGWMALAGMIGAGVASALTSLRNVAGLGVHQWLPGYASIEMISHALGILAFLALYSLQRNSMEAVGRFGFGLLLAGAALSYMLVMLRGLRYPPSWQPSIFVVLVWLRPALTALGATLFGLGTVRARVLPEPFRRIPLALGAVALVQSTMGARIDGVAMDASSFIAVTFQVLNILTTLGIAAIGYAAWSLTRSSSGQAAPAAAAAG